MAKSKKNKVQIYEQPKDNGRFLEDMQGTYMMFIVWQIAG